MRNDMNPLLIGIFFLFFSWLAILSVFLFTAVGHYRALTKGAKEKDLIAILERIWKDIDVRGGQLEVLTKRLVQLEKQNLYTFQKVGLVRFNPFGDTGGDQSFALALLDGNNDGLIISSLHSRESTRIYAKLVRQGKGQVYELSEEEKRAIKEAKIIK